MCLMRKSVFIATIETSLFISSCIREARGHDSIAHVSKSVVVTRKPHPLDLK